MNKIFVVSKNIDITPTMSYEDLVKQVEPMLVPKGKDLVKSKKDNISFVYR